MKREPMVRATLKAYATATLPSWRRFQASLADPRRAQARVLDRVLGAMRHTEFARQHGVRRVRDFRERIPVRDDRAYAPWIERQMASEARVIVNAPVRFYEKTSGSTGPQKFVPFTDGLQGSFTRMFMHWARDVIVHGPHLETGRTFFLVSPSFDVEEHTGVGVPVGLDDDSGYLTGWVGALLRRFLVDTSGLGRMRDVERYKLALAATLLAADDLEIMSVWSPTFLLVLMEFMEANLGRLVDGMGSATHGGRRRQLRAWNGDWQRVWPRLKLISCWDAADSKEPAAMLRRRFPDALVQGKGLLATEAPMTIPLLSAGGAHVPVVDGVFFEFQGADGSVRLLHEVVEGESYSVIISQLGGLYRYAMGDRVRVTGYLQRTPCLQFEGREGGYSDMVGEKLHESMVRNVLEELRLPADAFRCLIARNEDGRRCYVLLTDAYCRPDALGTRLEARLSTGHHYRHARSLGQLGAAEVLVASDARERLARALMAQGMKWGNIKDRILVRGVDARGWRQLDGRPTEAGALESEHPPGAAG